MDIFNNRVPSNLLTRDEYLELEKWKSEGGVIQMYDVVIGTWMESDVLDSYSSLIFRASADEPKKPSINWDHVHPKYKWLARDKRGTIHLFSVKPESNFPKNPDADEWSWQWNTCVTAETFDSLEYGDCLWYKSLIERT